MLEDRLIVRRKQKSLSITFMISMQIEVNCRSTDDRSKNTSIY